MLLALVVLGLMTVMRLPSTIVRVVGSSPADVIGDVEVIEGAKFFLIGLG